MHGQHTCTTCGTPAAPDNTFCAHCGQRLAERGEVIEGAHGDEQPTNEQQSVGAEQRIPVGVGAEQSEGPHTPPHGYAYAPSNGTPPPAPPGWQPSGYGGPPAPPTYIPLQQPQPQPGRRNAGLITALAVAVFVALLGLGAAILFAVSGGDEDPAAPAVTAATAASAASEPAQRSSAAAQRAAVRRAERAAERRAERRAARARAAAPPAQPVVPEAQPEPRATTSASELAGVERAVQRHWALIESGDYSAAYDLFAPEMQGRFSRDGWIQDHREDNLTSVSVTVDPTMTGTDTANARIISMRTDAAATGCHTWTGSYDLQRVSGVWRISQSNLSRGSC